MIGAHIDPTSKRSFAQTIQALADSTDRPVEEVLRQQGRLLSHDLAFHTLPLGTAASVGADMRRRIAQRVWSFYLSVGECFAEVQKRHGAAAAKSVVRLIRTGRHAEAQTLLNGRLRFHSFSLTVGPFDGGDLHRRHRFSPHRRHPIRIVTKASDVRTYIAREQKQAGFAKRSILTAGRQIEPRGKSYAAWLKPNDAPGRGRLTRLKSGFHGTLESLVRYIREALPFHRELRALDVRQQTAEKQLKRITDANLRKAMRRQRRR